MEEWRKAVGFEGFYEVSGIGRVRSVERVSSDGRTYKSIIRKFQLTDYGHYTVHLSVEGNQSREFVHIMVAKAFLGHKPEKTGLVVHHVDNVPTNNVVSNLRLITQRDNVYTHHVGSSKCKGVSRHKEGKWKAAIYHNGKDVYLGLFTKEKDACSAYQEYKLRNNIN